MNDADTKPENSSEIAENNETETQSSEMDKTINFMASDTVWVNIRLDGETAFSGILEAGEKESFELEERLYMKIGNGSAITAEIGGENYGPWAGNGEIAEIEILEEDQEISINNLRE